MENAQYIDTFQVEECTKISISFYLLKEDKITKEADIEDQKTITKILDLMRKIPDKGRIMKRMAPGDKLNVKLTLSENEVRYFTYFGNNIKTPATSFFPAGSGPKEQKELLELLKGLLEQQ